ncbi:hypothetical protein SCLCIDRAFT_1173330, partial [Scleroderma citrinum Foug A]
QGASGPTIHAQTASRIYEAHGGIHVRETSGLLAKYFKWDRERDGSRLSKFSVCHGSGLIVSKEPTVIDGHLLTPPAILYEKGRPPV